MCTPYVQLDDAGGGGGQCVIGMLNRDGWGLLQGMGWDGMDGDEGGKEKG